MSQPTWTDRAVPAGKGKPMHCWQYHQIVVGLGLLNEDSQLEAVTQAGSVGWELVSVAPITGDNGETKQLLYVFKRPVAESELQQ